MMYNDDYTKKEIVMENLKGLTSKEVEIRIIENKVNTKVDLPSKSTLDIIKSNVFTLFNGLNIILATIIIIFDSPKNALFSIVVITNTLVGIFQELKAKNTLEKLSLMNKFSVPVLRNGDIINISAEEIVIDDLVLLQHGDQVVADGILVTNEDIEVDESSLTGESDPILKNVDDTILSGSHVLSGQGYLKITQVSGNTYISKLSNEAKQFKTIESEIKTSIKKIVKIILFMIIPIGGVLLFSQIFLDDKSLSKGIVGVVAAIIGMLPQGLVLLTTAAFLVSVVKLSRWNTLVQELPATEMLARIDTICLDKTGTLTEGVLSYTELIPIDMTISKEKINEKLSISIFSFSSENPTKKAISEKLDKIEVENIVEKIVFSSSRKWSGVRLDNNEVLILGAPEIVLKDKYSKYSNIVEEKAIEGKRVIVLCSNLSTSINDAFNENLNPLAFVVLEDSLRKNVEKTINYFKKQKINIKIISGDNPVTVSAISCAAGVPNGEKYIDGNDIPNNYEDMKNALENFTVFGRVTPEQKKNLVVTLKDMGRTVAMTGDGVNDILALKESHCGIALASGNSSTKSVAQIVLLDSDFSSIPKIIGEGRKIINNLERVASLYLTKTIYSILLSIIFSVYLMPYPFIPIQLTLIGALLIGIPSFFLAFTPNTDRVKGNFLSRLLSKTVPKGFVVALFTFLMFFIANKAKLDILEIRTLAVLTAGGIGLVVLLKVAKPLNLFKASLVFIMFLLFSLAFITPLGKNIFSFTTLSSKYLLISIGLIVISYFIIDIFIKIVNKIKKQSK